MYRLDREWVGRSLEKKDLGMLAEMLIVASNVHSRPRNLNLSWAAARAVWAAGRGRVFCLSTLIW